MVFSELREYIEGILTGLTHRRLLFKFPLYSSTMSHQIASPTPSVELPGEIDMDLWAQLENEMERVDENGEDEGAKDEVMTYAPAGQVTNDRVSLADNDKEDHYFINATAVSMSTYTAAPVDEAQFVAPFLTPTEPTTSGADTLEELYPYRNLSRNERRHIARQIKKAHVNNLLPVPDHLRADNFKQAVDWTRGKAIPKWYEPGVVATVPASPSKANETTKKDDPSPKRGRKRSRSTTDSRSPSPSKKQRRSIPDLPILKTWGTTPAIPGDAYWTNPTAYSGPSFKPVLVTRHQLFVSERMAAGFAKSYPNLVARMSEMLYIESPVLNVATPVICPQDKCTIALGDLEHHIIEYHKVPGTEESFICRCSSRRSRIKKTETFTSSKEMLKHFQGMHLVEIKSCCPYCSARITAEDENMFRHWYQCCKGFKALNEEASQAA